MTASLPYSFLPSPLLLLSSCYNYTTLDIFGFWGKTNLISVEAFKPPSLLSSTPQTPIVTLSYWS